jgi:uncharacterized protein
MVCRMTTPPQPPPPPPPAGGGAPPAGYANNDEKTWALVAHFGGAGGVFLGCGVLGWVPPLIAMLAKGKESQTVRAHSVAALNFHITWAGIIAILYILLTCLGTVTLGIGFIIFPLVWLVALVPLIFGILAGVKATNGEFYTYPMAITLVK